MTIAGGYQEIAGGTKWIGDDGWVWVTRGNIDAQPKSLLTREPGSSEIRLMETPGHYRQFIQSVRSRTETIAPLRVALRSATPGWLGQIAMLTGRKLKWDPARQRLARQDPAAEKLLSRTMRAPWKLG